MILPIYLYGQAVLREKAEPIDLSEKEEIKTLVGDLWDTIAKADGCGLASPQVGISKRVVIVFAVLLIVGAWWYERRAAKRAEAQAAGQER